jgi:hypothetical protein
MMEAEKALKDAHNLMLEKKYDDALEMVTKALVEAKITINSIRHMKEQDHALRQQTASLQERVSAGESSRGTRAKNGASARASRH